VEKKEGGGRKKGLLLIRGEKKRRKGRENMTCCPCGAGKRKTIGGKGGEKKRDWRGRKKGYVGEGEVNNKTPFY